jgi:hypothetical protein
LAVPGRVGAGGLVPVAPVLAKKLEDFEVASFGRVGASPFF